MNNLHPFFRRVLNRRSVGIALCAAAVLTPLFIMNTAKAQPNIQLNPNLQLRNIAKLQIQVQPALLTKLKANKATVAANVLDQSFVSRNNLTFFKLPNGEEKQLIPLSQMEGGPQANTEQLPPEVSEAASYITGAKVTDVARTAVFKINPNWIINLSVDHRSDMTPIKDQGSRGTCVAFASNAAMEIWPSIPDDLSEQYTNDLFMRKENRQACDAGITTTDAPGYLNDGTVVESIWNYTTSAPACNTVAPAAAASATKYKIKEALIISDGGPTGAASIKNPRYLESLLQAGKNIVLGTHVAWGSPNSKGVLDVVLDSNGNPAASRGGHAMLICGYDAVGDYFIVKNSWGTGFGHNGYAYLSYDYIRTYAKYGYVIRKVEPALLQINPGLFNPDIIKKTPKIRIPR